jgi:CheY-like chemotaxis protein
MSAKILVVDDNPINLKLVSDLLEFEGHEILKAGDAEEAQIVLADTLPELILMDIALPGMDGLTLTRKLKAAERTRSIRIVALTAFAMKGDDQKAFDAGCDGYITKPIDTRALPEQVAAMLESEKPTFSMIEDDPAGMLILRGEFNKADAPAAGCVPSNGNPLDTCAAARQTGTPEKESNHEHPHR